MNKIDVLVFDKKWNEIPDQDNPAFDRKDGENRKTESVMVIKSLPYSNIGIPNDSWTVIFVPFSGDVSRLGVFWKKEDAILFANAYAVQTYNNYPF